MEKKYKKFIDKKKDDHIKEKSSTIALDFDGVIHSYKKGWTGDVPEDEPMEGIEEFLKKLKNNGWVLKILSTRDEEYIEDWLVYYKLDKYIKSIHNYKIPAQLYIDDRGYHFDGDFEKALDFIQEFKEKKDNEKKERKKES